MIGVFSNLPVEHLVLCFCYIADVICHVPQIDNSCAHLQTYHSHPKHQLDHPHYLHLVHVLLHLLLAVVLHSRLVCCCNEAMVWVQALAVETIRTSYCSCKYIFEF